jgi:hypothetical protein
MTIPSIIIASGRLASGVGMTIPSIIIASGVPIGGLGGVTPLSRWPLAQAARSKEDAAMTANEELGNTGISGM